MSTGNHPLAGPVYTDKGNQKAPRVMQQGPRGPSLCWWCLRRLMAVPGKKGYVFFNIVRDRDNVAHRVHGQCTDQAISSGNKLEG